MSKRKHPAPQQPGYGESRFPDPFAPGHRNPPGNAPAGRPDQWNPPQRPLEGTVLPARSRGVAMPRRRGRWLTVGVPATLGGALGFSTFMVFGVSSLIGGGGLLTPLLAGLAIAAVAGGGTGLLLRNRKPKPVRLVAPDAQMPEGTRTLLEKSVKATTQQRRRLVKVRRRAAGPAAKPVFRRADALLQRINALLGSGSLQSRRPSDGDVMMLEGMATRYIPDLVDALEETVGFLASFEGDGRNKSLANLESIDQQLKVLAEGIERIESDVADGVSRSLEVHSEFLKVRFADQHLNPIIDI